MNWSPADLAADLADAPAVCVDAAGTLPAPDEAAFDVFLTTAAAAPAPWVRVPDPEAARDRVARAAAASPVAAAVLLKLMRMTAAMDPAPALAVESLAYSTLLGGAEFRRWLDRRGDVEGAAAPAEPVLYRREADEVTLTMDDPASRNAYSAAMRDALAAALDTCLVDPALTAVRLSGGPRVFCSGGSLAEFGRTRDLAQAHLIRMSQSATARLFQLGSRGCAVVGGAAIGSGAEIAAAAGTVVAHPRSWFQLPELAMGLIPGAGGTVSVPRRIGSHRAAWLMLTGQRIGAAQALEWGLVDRLVQP